MAFQKLSILIPVYNERYFVGELVDQVLAAPLPEGLDRELIMVDDCSTDGTRAVLEKLAQKHPDQIRLYFHEVNQGKGAAIRTAIQQATGDISIIQDADLEYDPQDYSKLLRPILNGDADVVYGSRFLSSDYRRVLFFWHSVMNRFLTTLSNIFTDLNLTDMETCYKVAKTGLLKSIPIRSNRFGIEPEITAKFAKRNCRIYEVPISYRGRTYNEGKKITWRDGLKAIFIILYFWLVDDIYDDLYGHDILHSLSKAHRFNTWMADAVKPWVGEHVLEIGAGLGNLSSKMLPREAYTASDLDPLYLDYLKSRFNNNPTVDVRKVDLENTEDFNEIEGRFDSIICLNVLEHVNKSDLALQNMYRALTPGGTAIILVPQGQWLYGSLDRVLEHHLRYSRKQLIEKCTAAGFEMEKVFTFNRMGLWPWFINGKIFRRKRFNKLQLKFFDTFVWLWRRLDRFLPWPGLSVVGIARKPR
ncbi:MAG: glycosyltransferase [bacterium]|nr:glycosyltransferase [bacterium]